MTALAEVSRLNTEFEEKLITIDVKSDFTYEVDQTYLVIPHDGQVSIHLLIQSHLDEASTVRFDIPAISFIGAQPHAMVDRQSDTEVVINWVNDEGYHGRSFFYRIHMVGTRKYADGTTKMWAISHDPTIHNDPPS